MTGGPSYWSSSQLDDEFAGDQSIYDGLQGGAHEGLQSTVSPSPGLLAVQPLIVLAPRVVVLDLDSTTRSTSIEGADSSGHAGYAPDAAFLANVVSSLIALASPVLVKRPRFDAASL
jgi:hypothetical protein